tara:strand:- start:3979 stop:4638 length:660 start_codon:yes stop_codon:yes gene_type:complete
MGIYFYAIYGDESSKEGFTNKQNNQCPNLLIQRGSRFYLFNSKLAKVPGVNPIEFDNLEDYTEFLDWQRSQQIRCPVLYLQHTYDVQGNPVYKVRPSVSEPQGGLQPSNNMPPSIASSEGDLIMESSLGTPDTPAYPDPSLLVDASRNDPPYNKNSYPGFDASSYYVGRTTPLDAMDIIQDSKPVSADPMAPNWGGAKYTQSLVDRGYYEENNVKIAIA